ncbi:hypothetical protein [Enterovirga rhinocerotis]|uniref:hypothetical protein n=1 Tax=Enterovirga rhinocerotis TaxID=1339210 RepID=UPI00105F588A|nr:hypothetical protein [Enterovirga rhinocerotis]
MSIEKFPPRKLAGLLRSGSAITRVIADTLSRRPSGAVSDTEAIEPPVAALPPALAELAFVQVDRLVLERVIQTADALALEIVYEDLKDLFSTVDDLDASEQDGDW